MPRPEEPLITRWIEAKSKSWQELMDQYLPDKKLAQLHKKLLGAKYLDHLVFPLALTDAEITELVKSVGGTVKKFQHSETQTHVWFWADNTTTQAKVIELAYKLKGHLIERKEIGLRKTSDVLDELDSEDDLADAAEEHLKKIGPDYGRPEAS